MFGRNMEKLSHWAATWLETVYCAYYTGHSQWVNSELCTDSFSNRMNDLTDK